MKYILSKDTACSSGNHLLRFHEGTTVEVAPGINKATLVPGSSRRIFVSSNPYKVGDVVDINVDLLKEVGREHEGRKCVYWELK